MLLLVLIGDGYGALIEPTARGEGGRRAQVAYSNSKVVGYWLGTVGGVRHMI